MLTRQPGFGIRKKHTDTMMRFQKFLFLSFEYVEFLISKLSTTTLHNKINEYSDHFIIGSNPIKVTLLLSTDNHTNEK